MSIRSYVLHHSVHFQDIFLLSSPGPLSMHLVVVMAELCGWEVEHMIISKDTPEADLKHRRENIDGGILFSDQASVRAAIHGRVFVMDGIEKAERNVLPTLNNLLENHEVSSTTFLLLGHVSHLQP